MHLVMTEWGLSVEDEDVINLRQGAVKLTMEEGTLVFAAIDKLARQYKKRAIRSGSFWPMEMSKTLQGVADRMLAISRGES